VDSELTNVITQDLGDNATMWSCWTQIDKQRWLLADDFGKLFFLMIEVIDFQVSSWRLDPVGVASKASCLVYLDDGYVFVGSHSGDSQVVHIEEEGIRIVQTFPNIAPILDFTIMDLGRGGEGGQAPEFSSGQARVVAASGAWQDGTIRSVRSGVGLELIGTIGELPHITDLWGVSSTGLGNVHDTLIVSFITETRIFQFDSKASVEEVDDFHHLELSQPTLFAANLPDRKLVQVFETGIKLTDLDSDMLMLDWRPPDANSKLTAASGNSVHLLVVEGGGIAAGADEQHVDVAVRTRADVGNYGEAVRGHDRIVALLLAARAHPNYANAAGGTALMAAASRGLVDVSRSLVLAGAKANLKDASGRTAADWALQGGYVALAHELGTLT